MKFLADVNITQTVIKFLRQNGHDVLDIKKENLKFFDVEIIKIALKENRIILTHDKDFLALVKYPKYQVGVIAIRLKRQNAQYFCERLRNLFEDKTEEALNNSLTIITEETTTSNRY